MLLIALKQDDRNGGAFPVVPVRERVVAYQDDLSGAPAGCHNILESIRASSRMYRQPWTRRSAENLVPADGSDTSLDHAAASLCPSNSQAETLVA